jgi:hypothetical protein
MFGSEDGPCGRRRKKYRRRSGWPVPIGRLSTPSNIYTTSCVRDAEKIGQTGSDSRAQHGTNAESDDRERGDSHAAGNLRKDRVFCPLTTCTNAGVHT